MHIYIRLYNRNHDIFTSMECRYLLYINIVAPHNIKSIEYKQSYKRQVSFSIIFSFNDEKFLFIIIINAYLYVSLLLRDGVQWPQETIKFFSVVGGI